MEYNLYFLIPFLCHFGHYLSETNYKLVLKTTRLTEKYCYKSFRLVLITSTEQKYRSPLTTNNIQIKLNSSVFVVSLV